MHVTRVNPSDEIPFHFFGERNAIIPYEMIFAILSHLNLPSLANCLVVSRSWNRVVEDEAPWRSIFKSLSCQTMQITIREKMDLTIPSNVIDNVVNAWPCAQFFLRGLMSKDTLIPSKDKLHFLYRMMHHYIEFANRFGNDKNHPMQQINRFNLHTNKESLESEKGAIEKHLNSISQNSEKITITTAFLLSSFIKDVLLRKYCNNDLALVCDFQYKAMKYLFTMIGGPQTEKIQTFFDRAYLVFKFSDYDNVELIHYTYQMRPPSEYTKEKIGNGECFNRIKKILNLNISKCINQKSSIYVGLKIHELVVPSSNSILLFQRINKDNMGIESIENVIIALPNSIMLRIFSLLSPTELVNSALVSKVWKAISYHESLWITHLSSFEANRIKEISDAANAEKIHEDYMEAWVNIDSFLKKKENWNLIPTSQLKLCHLKVYSLWSHFYIQFIREVSSSEIQMKSLLLIDDEDNVDMEKIPGENENLLQKKVVISKIMRTFFLSLIVRDAILNNFDQEFYENFKGVALAHCDRFEKGK